LTANNDDTLGYFFAAQVYLISVMIRKAVELNKKYGKQNR